MYKANMRASPHKWLGSCALNQHMTNIAFTKPMQLTPLTHVAQASLVDNTRTTSSSRARTCTASLSRIKQCCKAALPPLPRQSANTTAYRPQLLPSHCRGMSTPGCRCNLGHAEVSHCCCCCFAAASACTQAAMASMWLRPVALRSCKHHNHRDRQAANTQQTRGKNIVNAVNN